MRGKSTPKAVIYRLYKRSKIIQLVTVLIKSRDRLRRRTYVCTQLAIATKKESQNKLICGSDKKANTQLAIHVTPYVRTQLAIAKWRLSAREKRRKYAKNNERYRNRGKSRLTSKYDLTGSCIEQPCVSTQQAIAIIKKPDNTCLLYTSPSPRD